MEQNSASNMKSDVFYDGLGRQWEAQKRAGSQVIDICRTYDGRSRLASVSNPAFSSVSFGVLDTSICGLNATTYAYDGINRTAQVTAPDGSATNYQYQGVTQGSGGANQTLEIEPSTPDISPSRRDRLQYFDGVGRLVEVDENSTSSGYGVSGKPTYTTTYGYDALDDLTGVAQSGQSRSFTYNSLKRLVQAINPESGTIKYSYDQSGNVATRTDPLHITTMSYDRRLLTLAAMTPLAG
jgi:YD repeat-containing protein